MANDSDIETLYGIVRPTNFSLVFSYIDPLPKISDAIRLSSSTNSKPELFIS